MIKMICDMCRKDIDVNFANGKEALINQGQVSIRISATVGDKDGALCRDCVETVIKNNTWKLVDKKARVIGMNNSIPIVVATIPPVVEKSTYVNIDLEKKVPNEEV